MIRILILLLFPVSLFAQQDSVILAYPDVTTLGEHSFRATRNTYIGKIAPTPTRPHETLVYVAVGENDTRGYLAVTATNVWENELIEGEAKVQLGNHETLTCSRRRLFNTTNTEGNQIAIALYFLSFGQLRQIARYGIISLEFPLMDVRTDSLTPCVLNQEPVTFSNK